MGRGGAVACGGRGRGSVTKGQYPKKDFTTLRNGIGKKALCDIEILHTDTLVKEVYVPFEILRILMYQIW